MTEYSDLVRRLRLAAETDFHGDRSRLLDEAADVLEHFEEEALQRIDEMESRFLDQARETQELHSQALAEWRKKLATAERRLVDIAEAFGADPDDQRDLCVRAREAGAKLEIMKRLAAAVAEMPLTATEISEDRRLDELRRRHEADHL